MKKRNVILKALIILLFVGIAVYSCSDRNYKIKTEYGDLFYAHSDFWSDDASISCLEHNFCLSISSFESKSDLSPVCDTEFFRCYKLQNHKEHFYICGVKPKGDYFWIVPNIDYSSIAHKDDLSESVIKVFLADKYIMQVTMNYMDGVYHDEIMEMAQKLTSGNYEGLDKYGLTEEMINDKESLDEKIRIMEEYLKANMEQIGTSSSVQ